MRRVYRKKERYTKDDAYKSLESINNWINNSDMKSSIMLGIIGVLITVIFSNGNIVSQYIKIFEKAIANLKCLDIIYLLLTILSFIVILLGIFHLIKVLLPTLSIKEQSNKQSILYFGSIGQYKDNKSFIATVKHQSENEVLDGILEQIYINSTICTKKFNSFKLGFKLFMLGFSFNVILFILGTIIYLWGEWDDLWLQRKKR